MYELGGDDPQYEHQLDAYRFPGAYVSSYERGVVVVSEWGLLDRGTDATEYAHLQPR
jgi:hypothetical protein